jgi:predicted small lipoprotein YifL
MTPFLHRRLFLRLLAAAPLAAALAACGRKADPRPPEDADPRAPRVYPVDRSRPPEARPRQDQLPPAPEPTVPAPPPPLSPLEYRP